MELYYFSAFAKQTISRIIAGGCVLDGTDSLAPGSLDTEQAIRLQGTDWERACGKFVLASRPFQPF